MAKFGRRTESRHDAMCRKETVSSHTVDRDAPVPWGLLESQCRGDLQESNAILSQGRLGFRGHTLAEIRNA